MKAVISNKSKLPENEFTPAEFSTKEKACFQHWDNFNLDLYRRIKQIKNK